MDPSVVAWLLGGWIVAAMGATIGVAAFFKGAHSKERELPRDEAGLREWMRPGAGREKPRAA
jgi:hypothetical protein